LVTASTLAQAFEEALAMDAPLSARLASYVQALRDLGSPYATAYDRLVAQLVSGDAGASAPKPGEPMPPFMLPSDRGTLISLDELLCQGPVVVSFNRGHWCPLCRLELAALTRIHERAKAHGGQIVSIVPERQPFAQKIKTKFNVPFPVVSDIDNGYALSLGLVMWVGKEVCGLYARDGVNLPEFSGGGGWFLPIPATFVVGRDGRVLARFVDPDFRKRMEVDAIVGALGFAAA
jgi:peroxiredoxin